MLYCHTPSQYRTSQTTIRQFSTAHGATLGLNSLVLRCWYAPTDDLAERLRLSARSWARLLTPEVSPAIMLRARYAMSGTDLAHGGMYAYRASKTAVNMVLFRAAKSNGNARGLRTVCTGKAFDFGEQRLLRLAAMGPAVWS
eukprot:3763780-Rhodomonas_salina.4